MSTTEEERTPGQIPSAEPIAILYENWRGETAFRHIIVGGEDDDRSALWFGLNEWHRVPQYLLSAWDVEKGAYRDFALSGIKAWGQAAVDAALAAAPSSPGVPDSVRALLGRVRDVLWREGLTTSDMAAQADAIIREMGVDSEINAGHAPETTDATARIARVERQMREHGGVDSDDLEWMARCTRTLLSTHPAGQSSGQGAEARTVLEEACKPWEHYTGEPPDDGSPLSGVFVAGMAYAERLLAKLLDVTHYEGGDGSEDFDNDATQTLRNILTGAGLWDADENRPVSFAPDSTRTGPVGMEEGRLIGPKMTPEQEQQIAHNLCGEFGPDAVMANAAFAKAFYDELYAAARPAAPEAQGAERVRHVKRGTEYEVLGEAVAQVSAVGGRVLGDYDKLTVYCGSDGRLWCRFTDEFRDGRFVPASSGQESAR